MSKSDRPSTPPPAATARVVSEPITRQTKIAEVVDYPLELYARERSRHFEENPTASGLPVWLVLVLIGAFLAVVALAVITGPTSVATLVGLGVLVVILLGVLQVRARATGALPAERLKELEELDRTIKETFKELGIKCHGCGAAYVESFEQGAKIHGFDAEQVVATLNTLGIDLAKIRYEEEQPRKA